MRIAFVVADYPSVSETFIARQIAGMLRLGHEVTVLAGHHYPDRPDPLDGAAPIRVIRPTHASRWRTAAPSLRHLFGRAGWRRWRPLALALRRRCSAAIGDLVTSAPLGAYDAIVAHFGPMGVRAQMMREAGLLHGPLAVVFHGKDMSDRWTLERYLPLYRRLFAAAELLLPISQLWRERLIGWGARADRTIVLRMGVDLAPEPAAAVSERPVRTPLRVLSVARLVEKKGIGYAIAGVARATAPVRYDVIGDGPLWDDLRAQAEAAGGAITLLGKQSHAAVLARLAEADVFLLPSVTAAGGDMEGIPVALMEAMAASVLVVATRHSGIPELIDDGVTGLLIAERDSEGIAIALDSIARGAIDTLAMRHAARATVADRFNNVTLDDELERLLAGIAHADEQRDRASAVARPAIAPVRQGAA